MAPQVYKITINLKKTGQHHYEVASRTDSGRVLRSIGVFSVPEDFRGIVKDHQQAVTAFDEEAFKRVHDLATAEAQKAAVEYKQKEAK